MKKIFLSVSIVSVGTICMAMDTTIKLPEASVLRSRLDNAGFEHFVQKTEIDSYLGKKEMVAEAVVVSVVNHLDDYNQYLKMPQMTSLLQKSRPIIIQLILKDNPEALAHLKSEGLLQ